MNECPVIQHLSPLLTNGLDTCNSSEINVNTVNLMQLELTLVKIGGRF